MGEKIVLFLRKKRAQDPQNPDAPEVFYTPDPPETLSVEWEEIQRLRARRYDPTTQETIAGAFINGKQWHILISKGSPEGPKSYDLDTELKERGFFFSDLRRDCGARAEINPDAVKECRKTGKNQITRVQFYGEDEDKNYVLVFGEKAKLEELFDKLRHPSRDPETIPGRGGAKDNPVPGQP